MPPRKAKDPSAEDTLVVTSQQSRFHTEMDETNNLKEIIVKDLTIALANRELLSHATLNLQRGRHYVLHGRNGIGKSTLLRAIAEERIPSIPRGVRVVMLGQTEGVGVEEQGGKQDESALEYVVRSDKKQERLRKEAKILEKGLEVGGEGAARAWRKVEVERLQAKVFEAGQIALKRSGARGKDARKVLITLEEDLKAAEARRDASEVSVEELSTETQRAAEELDVIQASLEDPSSLEAHATNILLGLGFSQASIAQPRSTLSGGWKTRSSLAAALSQTPDVLLLDEPTNFLDLPSIIWLERHLTTSLSPNTTLLVVTHDRAFGDSIAEELLALRELTLTRFRGNLSLYESERLKHHAHQTKLLSAVDKQKKHVQASIQSNLSAAKKSGDDKKLKQAASRQKKLDERMGVQTSAKGTRFKLNRDRAGYFTSNRGDVELPTFDPPASMHFPSQPSDLRFPGALASLENVSFAFRGSKADLLHDIALTIHPGDRIGLAGLNGSGKSTLVSLLTGAKKARQGIVTIHPRARIGVYTQQIAEELEQTYAEESALKHIMAHAELSADGEKDARAALSGVGLQGRIASDVPISALSGGQRVRLALAKLVFPSAPHLLVLDEVTTHLDTDTIAALIGALRSYEGAVLVVTHDRFFMKTVVEGVSVKSLAAASRPEGEEEEESGESDEDEEEEIKRTRTVFRLSKGKLTRLERGMEQYEEIAARAASKLGSKT